MTARAHPHTYSAFMDPISDILAHLDFKGMLYFSTEFSGRWGVRVPDYPGVIRFHLALRGDFHVRVAGSPALQHVHEGDFLMIPHGAGHDLLAHPDVIAPPIETVLQEAGYSGEGPLIYAVADAGHETRLLCGHFSFSPEVRRNRFLATLPETIVARALPDQASDWIGATLSLLATEAQAPRPGHDIIVHRMTEILFVQALRHWMTGQDLPTGVLKALGNPQLAPVIGQIHQNPQTPWTVESLARIAGLSRTVFAERFHRLTGMPPLKYLTEWRLTKARRMLRAGDRSVDEIALAVGYGSTPAFSRIYSRHYGEGPGRTRRMALQNVA